MGRRSMAAERRQQVMEAASRCMARNGLAGTTLEKIAEESGLSRSHIRHYVGNRDDLLLALVDWVQERDDRAFAAAVEQAPPEQRLAVAMDHLFGAWFLGAGDEGAVILELVRAGQSDDTLREAVMSGYRLMLAAIDSGLAAEFPESTPVVRRGTAYGLLCLALGNAMMSDLDRPLGSGGLIRVAGEALVAQLGAVAVGGASRG
ncbi:helix-turn-helix domain-containing protein [Streptomyces phaeochromogenes]|uniref:TetR/AcrR family transcriptional regulator n=1 Tax=Streptomyces phaeochromogenes TaxID=1923 RepID=UPI002DD9B0DD|nr:helix-turn-helix domain-containing protein [Streptomyces phaeochromogenes]WRZ34681.1 TetR/AcrR family transcriptional regulator [Streptomyces phaeochromogenes]